MAIKKAQYLPDDMADVRDNPIMYGLPEDAKTWDNDKIVHALGEFATASKKTAGGESWDEDEEYFGMSREEYEDDYGGSMPSHAERIAESYINGNTSWVRKELSGNTILMSKVMMVLNEQYDTQKVADFMQLMSTGAAKKTASLAEELHGAKVVHYDPETGLVYAWFGGTYVNIYDDDGYEVDVFSSNKFNGDSEKVLELIAEQIEYYKQGNDVEASKKTADDNQWDRDNESKTQEEETLIKQLQTLLPRSDYTMLYDFAMRQPKDFYIDSRVSIAKRNEIQKLVDELAYLRGDKERPAPESKTDFNEDIIKVDMAKALDVSEEDLEISNSYFSDFGATAYTVTSGDREYVIVANEGDAEIIVEGVVKQDLDTDPERFTQSWLNDYYDIDFEDVITEDIKSYANDIKTENSSDSTQWANRLKEEIAEQSASNKDDFVSILVKDALDDDKGLEYMKFNFGEEWVAEYLKEHGKLDIDRAVSDAIVVDGWPHFVSTYDGNYDKTDKGFIYWREN